jgi:hypothetical protein
MMRPQFGVYRAETYNFKMCEPDEFDEDDTFRCWRHQLEGRDPLGTMIIQGHLLLEEELNAFILEGSSHEGFSPTHRQQDRRHVMSDSVLDAILLPAPTNLETLIKDAVRTALAPLTVSRRHVALAVRSYLPALDRLTTWPATAERLPTIVWQRQRAIHHNALFPSTTNGGYYVPATRSSSLRDQLDTIPGPKDEKVLGQ